MPPGFLPPATLISVGRALAMVGLTAAAVGCGGGLPLTPSDCLGNLPAVCPVPAPRYAADVAPLLDEYCSDCHAPGGIQEAHSFATHALVANEAPNIRVQVDACLMPPADRRQPTAAERRTILGWIVCGARND